MKHKDWPYWAEEYKSRAHFKSVKRKQMDEVLKALDIASNGSAYMPLYNEFKQAEALLEKVRAAMRKREWK